MSGNIHLPETILRELWRWVLHFHMSWVRVHVAVTGCDLSTDSETPRSPGGVADSSEFSPETAVTFQGATRLDIIWDENRLGSESSVLSTEWPWHLKVTKRLEYISESSSFHAKNSSNSNP